MSGVVAPLPEPKPFGDEDLLEVVHQALELIRNEFEPKTFEAATGVLVEGRKAADMAVKLGMTEGAVYMARSRVLRRLRAELKDLMD